MRPTAVGEAYGRPPALEDPDRLATTGSLPRAAGTSERVLRLHEVEDEVELAILDHGVVSTMFTGA